MTSTPCEFPVSNIDCRLTIRHPSWWRASRRRGFAHVRRKRPAPTAPMFGAERMFSGWRLEMLMRLRRSALITPGDRLDLLRKLAVGRQDVAILEVEDGV